MSYGVIGEYLASTEEVLMIGSTHLLRPCSLNKGRKPDRQEQDSDLAMVLSGILCCLCRESHRDHSTSEHCLQSTRVAVDVDVAVDVEDVVVEEVNVVVVVVVVLLLSSSLLLSLQPSE